MRNHTSMLVAAGQRARRDDASTGESARVAAIEDSTRTISGDFFKLKKRMWQIKARVLDASASTKLDMGKVSQRR